MSTERVVPPSTESEPLITFYRMIPGAMRPMRADRAALGTLPVAALQYCEAITSASAFGWYVCSPMDFHVQWDGTDIIWTHDGGESWSPLTKAHFPGLPEVFDEKAPEDIRGYAPPFLTRVLEGLAPGLLQIWTGFMIRTRADWSVLVRPPANLARSHDYEPYEGIMETDRWFYPLFTNVRLTSTNRPIFFEARKPLIQVQPLRRDTYKEEDLRSFKVNDDVCDFSDLDWADYRRTIVVRSKDSMLRPGRYATAVRQRAHMRPQNAEDRPSADFSS